MATVAPITFSALPVITFHRQGHDGQVLAFEFPLPPLAGTAAFGAVSDTRLQSASAIRALKVLSWADTDATADGVTAPSILSLMSAGDFGADVTVDALGRMSVRGALTGSDVRSAGNIASVQTGSTSNSRIFAGVRGEVTDLPDGTDDFANPAATIGRLTLGPRGTFGNSLIAAPTVGRVVLGTVTTANGGRPFGGMLYVRAALR